MQRIVCDTPEMIVWCRVLHRLALVEMSFTITSLAIFVINIFMSMLNGFEISDILTCLSVIFTLVVSIPAVSTALESFDRDGRHYLRHEPHFRTLITAIMIGLFNMYTQCTQVRVLHVVCVCSTRLIKDVHWNRGMSDSTHQPPLNRIVVIAATVLQID